MTNNFENKEFNICGYKELETVQTVDGPYTLCEGVDGGLFNVTPLNNQLKFKNHDEFYGVIKFVTSRRYVMMIKRQEIIDFIVESRMRLNDPSQAVSIYIGRDGTLTRINHLSTMEDLATPDGMYWVCTVRCLFEFDNEFYIQEFEKANQDNPDNFELINEFNDYFRNSEDGDLQATYDLHDLIREKEFSEEIAEIAIEKTEKYWTETRIPYLFEALVNAGENIEY